MLFKIKILKIFNLLFFLTCVLLNTSQAQTPNLTLSSPAFSNNHDLPVQYTCHGTNINPALIIENVPHYTKSLVLFVHEPDNSKGERTHWILYNINPNTKIIPENSTAGHVLINSYNNFSYNGPCPSDTKIHYYIFELFALNTIYLPNENGSPEGLINKIQGNILERTRLVATYQNQT